MGAEVWFHSPRLTSLCEKNLLPKHLYNQQRKTLSAGTFTEYKKVLLIITFPNQISKMRHNESRPTRNLHSEKYTLLLVTF